MFMNGVLCGKAPPKLGYNVTYNSNEADIYVDIFYIYMANAHTHTQ